jgi:alanine dehydrogenase
VTTSFILALADKGWRRALNDDPHLRNGLNVHDGRITHRAGPRPKGREFLFC